MEQSWTLGVLVKTAENTHHEQSYEARLLSRPRWLGQRAAARSIKHPDLMVLFSSAEMFLRSALVTFLALPALIRGGQIPVVDGVIGGVPSGDAHNSSYKTLTGSGSGDPSCTPGKLRGVVENSCICGKALLFNNPPVIFTALAEKKDVYQASGYGDVAPGKSVWFVSNSGFSLFYLFICVLPTGSGSLPPVITPTRLPSLRGSMAA